MRWLPKPKYQWHKTFALFPVQMNESNHWVWWEWYEVRKTYGFTERRLINK